MPGRAQRRATWPTASAPGTREPPGPDDPRTLEAVAVRVAREAADLARAERDRAVAGHADLATKSSPTDVVTAADRACEDLVRARLAGLRPHDAVLGEEGGGDRDPGPGRVRWVVDPIDGTVNYTRGLPWFAVSVGAEVAGRAVAGAVVEPVSARVWSAARGHGARRDGERLRASGRDRLDLAVVATGLGYDRERRRAQAALLSRIAGDIGDVRRTGCASLDLCAVAAGWVDGFYEHGLNRWDWCAGALVAAEAGAWVHLPPEALDGVGAGVVVAAGPRLAAELTTRLRAHDAAAVERG